MENQNNKTNCNGKCQACNFQQRIYCAAYMARANFDMIGALIEKVDALQERINLMQSANDLITPLEEEKEVLEIESTRGTSGAENRLSKKSTISNL